MSVGIKLKDVHKQYGDVPVIHGIDLDVSPGEFVVFVGPSGCGKSTLLRMIAGLEPISGGDLIIDGQRMNDVPAARRGIAMVFQSYALYPHMSVYQNLAFGLETAKMPRAEIETRVQRAAEILKIEPLLKRKPKQLSGGQRQRVAIGRAIVREPKIFLFDEPLSNLDAELRVAMRVEIAKLHAQLGNTMIYVTHDQVEAMTMADKIVVLRAGVIEQVGAPLELYNNPRNLFVAGFIGSPGMNMVSSTIARRVENSVVVSVGDADLVIPNTDGSAGDLVTLGIRPEHISLSSGTGTRFAELRVDLVEQLGGQTIVYGTLPNGQSLTVALEGQKSIDRLAIIDLFVDPENAHLFASDGRKISSHSA